MPKVKVKLTDVEIRNYKPRDKAYKANDGGDGSTCYTTLNLN